MARKGSERFRKGFGSERFWFGKVQNTITPMVFTTFLFGKDSFPRKSRKGFGKVLARKCPPNVPQIFHKFQTNSPQISTTNQQNPNQPQEPILLFGATATRASLRIRDLYAIPVPQAGIYSARLSAPQSHLQCAASCCTTSR